jgi:oligopeptide/dipeptide ABC transporter ATP-binding protein
VTESYLETLPEGAPAAGSGSDGPVLEVENLHVQFPTDDGTVKAVSGISFELSANEVLGIVGESGSGKSVTSMAILGLLPRSAKVSGSIRFRGRDLLKLKEDDLRKLRGGRLAMVFQDALAALNPVFTVGAQIAEAVKVHRPDCGKEEVRSRVVELLELVGIPNAKDRAGSYPHEFSGGMRQRAMIAMAISNDPDVLVADEPTTALDVTIQAQVLEVLERVQERTHSAIILITHDLGVIAGMVDRVLVMYAGKPVETGTVDEIFYETRHPYTLGLLASLPRLDQGDKSDRLLSIRGQPPSLIFVPSGCSFHPRCPVARLPEPCSTEVPPLRPIDTAAHLAACHFAETLRDMEAETLKEEAMRAAASPNGSSGDGPLLAGTSPTGAGDAPDGAPAGGSVPVADSGGGLPVADSGGGGQGGVGGVGGVGGDDPVAP